MISNKISRIPFDLLRRRSFSTSTTSGIDSCSASRILSNCFKSGKVREAENLFDEIPDRNVVYWSILVHGYAINGFHRKCLESFSRMRISGVVPNSFAFVGVLVGIQDVQKLLLVQSVHGLILEYGLDSDPVVGTALLDSYAKCGNLADSCKVFDLMQNPGPISLNAMISGYIQNELYEEGVLLFNKFRRSGLFPNASTLLIVIQACIGLEIKSVCKSIQGLIIKLGLEAELSLNNVVLKMYSCLMDLDATIRVFEIMENKDVISWTTVIGLLVNLEYAVDALNLFVEMKANNVHVDAVVGMNLVSACMVLGDLRRGRQMHAQAIVCGFDSEIHLANSLITMYSNCSDLDSSRNVFRQMNRKSLVSWTAMISGHLYNGQPREALSLFTKLRLEEDYTLDSAIIVSITTASGDVAAFELCQQLHCLAFKVGCFGHRSVQNSFVSVYSNCGNMDFSYNVFKEMGCLQNIISWNAIINGYGINGQGEVALALYDEMRKADETPDSATYLCLLSACSHSGLRDEGLTIFYQLLGDNNVKPEKEHYGCIIDVLARGGCLLEACELISKSLDMMGPNALRALLSGCMLHGNVELAEVVAKRLFEQDPLESGQSVLLSRVYASVGRFKDAEALRSSMCKQGLRKNSGISSSNESSSDFG